MKLESLQKRARGVIDPASLGGFRLLFGSILILHMWHYLESGELIRDYIYPRFHFPYPTLAWITPLPDAWMIGLFALMVIIACMIAIGLYTRVSLTLFLIGITYIFFIDQSLFLEPSYLIILITFLLLFTDCNRCYSIDALRNPKPEQIPLWHLWILRSLLIIVYFFSVITKFNGEWISLMPVRAWHPQTTTFALMLFAYGGLLYEIVIIPLLLFRRTRIIAFIAVAVFHGLHPLFFQVVNLPGLMMVLASLYLPCNWPRTLFRLPAWKPVTTTTAKLRPVFLCVLVVFFILQVTLPFRHYFIPGNVSWTEEGRLYSWRMMSRDKEVHLVLEAETQSGTRFLVEPQDYLSIYQVILMGHKPHLTRQFARWIATEYQKLYGKELIVRSIGTVSINGRPPHHMIDPEVNLAAKELPKGWITPM